MFVWWFFGNFITHLHINSICPFLSSTLKSSQLSNNDLMILSIFQSILFKFVLNLLYRRQALSLTKINIGFTCTSDILWPLHSMGMDLKSLKFKQTQSWLWPNQLRSQPKTQSTTKDTKFSNPQNSITNKKVIQLNFNNLYIPCDNSRLCCKLQSHNWFGDCSSLTKK